MHQGISALYSTDKELLHSACSTATVSAIPVLFRALEEAPWTSALVLQATAFLGSVAPDFSYTSHKQCGSSLALLATLLQDRIDHEDWTMVRDGLLTAAHIAGESPTAIELIVNASIASVAAMFVQVSET
jgi:hypothetical protein